MRYLAIFLLFFLPSISQAVNPPKNTSVSRVILITLDGIRREDLFGKPELMPLFWEKYAKQAEIYGQPGSDKTMSVGAKIPYSLPSYQSMMTGMATACMDNDCPPLTIETFPEVLVKQYGLKRSEVASISSWEVMDRAFESQLGTAFSNHGTRPMHDPDKFTTDATMTALNKAQVKGYPGDDTRWDKDTLAQAMYYYDTYKPRFLWISFGDADDHAHDGNLTAYHQTLTFYDGAINQIINAVKRAGFDKQTMIIITTDHGRGLGPDWKEHEPRMPTAWQTWAIVINGKLIAGEKHNGKMQFSTLSLRPTIEQVFKKS